MISDLIIIGSGAVGLGAAIYTGRYRAKAFTIGKEFDGETATIENYPGFQWVDGYESMDLMKQQAAKLTVDMLDAEVTKMARHGHCFAVVADQKIYEANAMPPSMQKRYS